MASPYAFVTLLSSDAYLPGALTLAAALKDVHPSPTVPPEVDFQTVCLVTPETVDVSSIKLLRRAYDVVVGVEIIENDNQRGLQLLGRPDLTSVLTKLHVFRLVQYQKIIFLDADVLPTRPISHLFTLHHEFSAVPDVGWPDIFNSGLMVLTPSEAKFGELLQLSKAQGSWDGGDQGLLNEWRGDDWNRLSFTYNTTPTAVYTYAPAYERYGSQIRAIHFIGPNKPWVHIPWRAPGSSDSYSQTSEPLQAYDYGALVDRWYAVYDKHYRSTPIVTASDYASHRYEPAWESSESPDVDSATPVDAGGPPTTFSLEELRKLAIEGFSGPAYAHSGEGVYMRMPLEGRFDLMRPRMAESESVLGTEVDDGGLATPLASDHFFEEGATPFTVWASEPPQKGHPMESSGYFVRYGRPYDHIHGGQYGYSTGPSPEFPWSSDSHSEADMPDVFRTARRGSYNGHCPVLEHAHQLKSNDLDHHLSGQRPLARRRSSFNRKSYHHTKASATKQYDPGYQQHLPPERLQGHRYGQNQDPPPSQYVLVPVTSSATPSSPPLLTWNPAIEPPPNNAPVSNFPTETYFTNAWDRSTENHTRQGKSFRSPSPSALFEAPPPAQIPRHLLHERQYANVIGDSSDASPVPNPTKVKPVFPWEETPRHIPARVFPSGDAQTPSPFLRKEQKASHYGSPSSTASLPPITPPQTTALLSPPLKTLTSDKLGYANAWDGVPSIQKYASRLTRPPLSQALQPAFETNDMKNRRRSYGSWDSDDSSAEGDDEETDADDQDPAERERERRRRTRSGSNAKIKREYSSQGVQTIPREMRHVGVQVTVFSAHPDTKTLAQGPSTSTQHASEPRSRSQSGADSSQLKSRSNSTSGLNSPIISHPQLQRVQISESFIGQTPRISPSASPSGTMSPRMVRSPRGSQTDVTRTFADATPQHVQTSQVPGMTRRVSTSSDMLSTPSTLGPPQSPQDEFTPPVRQRKASRVWDPARGVEVFKKGSEEVLSRFLRMGSWEDSSR